VPNTEPARKAAFAGIHIILVPVPLTGVLPIVLSNNMAPLFTSSNAPGLVVPIPTFTFEVAELLPFTDPSIRQLLQFISALAPIAVELVILVPKILTLSPIPVLNSPK